MTTITRTAPVENHFRGGIDVRVSLRDGAGDGSSAFDGAWFPRGRDLGVELPELIAELERRGVRIERFTYSLEAWEPAPRKLVLRDRVVRTGGFRSMDPTLVSLTVDGDRRLDLLVVPPEADALTGVRALRLAGLKEQSSSAQRVLADAGSRPRPEVVPITGVRAG